MRPEARTIGTAALVALATLVGSSVATAGKAPERWTKESGLSEPKIVEKVAPVYPEEAKKDGTQGVVVVEATIGADGKVSDLRAIEDPDARLTAAALEAIAKWRFEPSRDAKGHPVAVRFTMTVAFKLS